MNSLKGGEEGHMLQAHRRQADTVIDLCLLIHFHLLVELVHLHLLGHQLHGLVLRWARSHKMWLILGSWPRWWLGSVAWLGRCWGAEGDSLLLSALGVTIHLIAGLSSKSISTPPSQMPGAAGA
jgi:hypothetical protein